MNEPTPIFEELAARYQYQRAALRRSLVESIGDEFAMCLTDGRLAEVVADWPGVAPIEVTG